MFKADKAHLLIFHITPLANDLRKHWTGLESHIIKYPLVFDLVPAR